MRIVMIGLMALYTSVSSTHAATDTISPVILTPAMDLVVSCDLAIEDSLQAWYDRFADLEAMDDSSLVTLMTTLTAPQALEQLDLDRSIQCGTTGMVEVGFYAIDSCANHSDTSFAVFEVIDTSGPVFTVLPSDYSIICQPGRNDSLNNWIATFGGATINDACSVMESFLRYEYSDTDGNNGSGTFNTAPNLISSAQSCDYELTVTFVAQDECGNESSATAIFSLIDTMRPIFESELPDTLVVNCDNVPSARSINVTDECVGSIVPEIIDISTQDPNDNTCEHFNYRVERTYVATDACGNEARISQVIFVTDTLEPRFVAPADTTILNDPNPDPAITGMPIDVIDNCSSEVIIDYDDNIETDGCQLIITRRWSIQDLCGSALVLPQRITVIDSMAPVLVSPAIDIILPCDSPIDIQSGFSDWVNGRANAIINDDINEISESFAAVPGSYDLSDPTTWPGTPPGDFDAAQCPSSRDGLIRYEEVDFVFIDVCGNALRYTATYGISDDEAPTITTMYEDLDITVDPTAGDCAAAITIMPPMGTDNCLSESNSQYSTGQIMVTAPDDEAPVDPVDIRLGPITGAINFDDDITLSIRISNIDANNPTEYFNIIDENGQNIGRTDNTLAQCGAGTTTITLTGSQLSAWIDDGFVDFRLEPNIINGVPSLSINTVCPNTAVSATLSLESNATGGLRAFYSINDSDQKPITADIDTVLAAGEYEINYYLYDCANNADSTTQSIIISGGPSEALVCPDDEIVTLLPATCSYDYQIDSLPMISDPCSGDMELSGISVSGATAISADQINSASTPIIIPLNVGNNIISYTYTDDQNNTSTCDYTVTVRDEEFPVISCVSNINLQVHPSGLLPPIIDTMAILTSAMDNCEIGSISIDSIALDCSDIGTQTTVTLAVSDLAGNITQCQTNARLIPYDLEPTADPVLCFGDTIRLFANVPMSPDPNVYSFRWTGPNGYVSTAENPVIPNASAALSGVYSLELTGFGGCRSTGSTEVFIQDFTSPDILLDASTFCDGDVVELSTFNYQSEVQYNWYEGTFPDGSLLAATDTAAITIRPSLGTHEYYLIIESDVCDSDFAPSTPVMIEILEKVEVMVADTFYSLCAGESIRFDAISDDTSLTHRWIGPNGFSSDQLIPDAIRDITAADAGTYTLISSRQGCRDSIHIEVEVIELLTTPVIESAPNACEGEPFVFHISNYDTADQFVYRWILNNQFYQLTNVDSLVINETDSTHRGEWGVIVLDSICRSDTSTLVNIDIIDQLDLTIGHDSLICEGDSIRLSIDTIAGATYEWRGPGRFSSTDQNPAAPSIAGTYSVIVTTATGCEHQFSTSISVTQRPLILSIFSDIDECTDGSKSAILNQSVFPDDGVEYAWTGPDGFTSDENRPQLLNYTSANEGYYTLVATRNGCPSIPDSAYFEINDIPSKLQLGGTDFGCVGDSVIITTPSIIDSSYQYRWTTPTGNFNTDIPSLTIDNITQEDAGLYIVRAVNQTCQSDPSDTLMLSIFRTPNPPTISSNVPVCLGEDLVLEVAQENDTEYEWRGPDGYSSDQNRIVIANTTIETQGPYEARIIKNGCPSDFALFDAIEYNDIPSAPRVDSPDYEVCEDDPTPIELCIDRDDFAAGVLVTWINTTNGVTIGQTNDVCLRLESTAGFNPGVNNIIAERIIDGCRSPQSVPVIVEISSIPDVSARAGDDMIACEIDGVSIAATEPLRGQGRWSSSDPAISFADATDFETEVFGLSLGQNELSWTLSNGPCADFSTDDLIITVETANAVIDDQYEVDYNTSSSFDITANDDLNDETIISIIQEPAFGVATLDDITRELTYEAGSRFAGEVIIRYEACSPICDDNCAEGQISIIVGDENDCFVPSVITPNNDGINDLLTIPCIASGDQTQNELYIYNQWGDEVYYAQPYENDWDGTYDGAALPAGTYFTVFQLTPDSPIIKGFIVIER